MAVAVRAGCGRRPPNASRSFAGRSSSRPTCRRVAAPGDQFEVGVTMANNVEGSGANAEVQLTVEPSEHLEIVASAPRTARDRGRARETSSVPLRREARSSAPRASGSRASDRRQRSQAALHVSVRPPVPFMTEVRSGNFTKDSVDLPMSARCIPSSASLDGDGFGRAARPRTRARCLPEEFPNGCSEQITSGAFCA